MIRACGAVGVIALVLAVLLGVANVERLLQAYLIGYAFWLLLALGCLGLAFVQFLTGGAWGLVTRRIFEAGAGTLPLLAVGFVPVLMGVPTLYPWVASAEPSVVHKAIYLNVPFFVARTLGYFATWLVLAEVLRRRSRAGDLPSLQRLSIIGSLLLPLTASFAAIDWLMSLEPEWFSTMYPPLICMVALLSAYAFAVLVVTRLRARLQVVEAQVLNDLGSLLLAFLLLWAYLTYFQYMLIWAGNLSDEITWYTRRTLGGWQLVAWVVAILGFLVPFWLLLFRGLKRNPRWLGAIAALVLAVQAVDVWWLVAPSFSPNGPPLDVLAFVLPLMWIGLGGLWLAVFAWRLGGLPLLAASDPRLAEAHEHAAEELAAT